MNYEWDETKALANRARHGVSFNDVIRFDWTTALLRADGSHDEERWITIGFIDMALHVLVFTERGETIRVLSLRKATKSEQRAYAQA